MSAISWRNLGWHAAARRRRLRLNTNWCHQENSTKMRNFDNGVTPQSILLRMWHGANTALLLFRQRILHRVLSHLHVEGLFRERPAPASLRRACNLHAAAGWQHCLSSFALD